MAPNTSAVQHDVPYFTRQDVSGHKKLDDCWIVIHGEVYNVTSWLKRHPGGARLLIHYAGEDASVSCSIQPYFGLAMHVGVGLIKFVLWAQMDRAFNC